MAPSVANENWFVLFRLFVFVCFSFRMRSTMEINSGRCVGLDSIAVSDWSPAAKPSRAPSHRTKKKQQQKTRLSTLPFSIDSVYSRWVLLSCTGFSLYLMSLTGFTGFYWVLMGFTGFYWVLLGFNWVLMGFNGFYWVLLGFNGFYWVSLGFTGFYRVW